MQHTLDEVAMEAAEIAGDNLTVNMQVCSRWAMEAIRKVGILHSFDKKTGVVEVKNYRADMPIDFYKLIDVGHGYQYIEHGYNLNQPVPTVAVHNCIMKTNFSTGNVTITYFAVPMDFENKILIEEDFYEAVLYFLIVKFLELRLISRPELLTLKDYFDNLFKNAAGETRGERQMPSLADLRRIVRERLQ